MLLNELENKEHKLNRINKWLNSEFGFTVDTATPENLAEVKKELEGVKVKMSESNDFNATHNDPLFKNNYDDGRHYDGNARFSIGIN